VAAQGAESRDALLAGLTSELLEAFRRGDEEGALRMLQRALSSGLDGPSLYLGVFQPALDQVGYLWEAGQASIAEEHQATAMTEWLMRTIWMEFQPRTSRAGSPLLLATCVPGERHDLGITMVSDFLRRDGWKVVNLRADLPAPQITRMVGKVRPGLCLLSAATAERLPDLRSTIAELRSLRADMPILVGGVVFRHDPTLAAGTGATGTARDAAEAVDRVHDLLGARG